MEQYVVIKDIVIPAGTIMHRAPEQTERYGEHAEACIELSRDDTAYLTVYVGEESEISEYIVEAK